MPRGRPKKRPTADPTPPLPTKRARRPSARQRKNKAQAPRQTNVDPIPSLPADKPPEPATGMSYFESHRGTVRTSNLTLASLNLLPAPALEKALQNLQDPLKDRKEQLQSAVVSSFPQLSYLLAAGHSLLFHGFGSKKSLLDKFATHQSQHTPVLVVNGFNPTVNLRSVLTQLTSEILHLPNTYPKRMLQDYIHAIRVSSPKHQLTVLIHNIDGPALRAAETQAALAMLADVPNITLVASVDHVNAPLLWDGVSYSRFAWAWIKADTFLPYETETVFCSKPLLRGGGERQIEGAIALLNSLSERARKVFTELAKRQTGGAVLREEEDGKDGDVAQTRTTFNQLFETCKEQFLASDQTSLNLILTELETHELLECRRGADAASQLWVPLQLAQLRTIVKAIDTS